MHAGQVLGREYLLADDGTAAGNEVHHACGYACLLVDLHQIVVGEDGCGGRLPYHGVAHQDGRHREVRCDGGEVERGQREDEALEGTVFHAVDLVGTALGLDAVDFGSKSGVVAQEVDRLTCGVDLCLIEILALPEHTGGIDDRTVFAGQQVCNFQHDGGSDSPVQLSPLLVRVQSRLDGHPDLFGSGLVVCGQHMTVVVRHHYLAGVAGADFLSADDQRYVELDTALSFKFCFEGHSLGRAFQIGFYRFIGRYMEIENCILHT